MSRPILIATIMRPEGDTGVQTHFRTLLSWFRLEKIQARLITPFDSPKWKVYPTFAVRRILEPISGAASVWWYRHWHVKFLFDALKNSLADGLPCIIYAQCPLSADAAMRARKSPEQRVVMVAHFNESQADEWVGKGLIKQDGPLYRSIRYFEETALPRLDGMVYVSDYMRQKLAERIPALKDEPYRVVPNFVADPGAVATPVELKADLICIGTLEPRKNQQYALEIVAASKKLGQPMRLTLVGDGPDRETLMTLAKHLKIEREVWFAGYISNAAALCSQHRAYLHVAKMESFGIVLIEAMSRGLPVFAPAVGGIPEVFETNVEGRLIPLDDAELAAKHILEWIDDTNQMRRASEAARARFLKHFEASVVARQLVGFLEQPSSSLGV